MNDGPETRGFTLIELIAVMAAGTALLVLALPYLIEAFSPRVKTSAECLADDIRFAQNEAVRQGNATIGGGAFRARKAFIVFDTANNAYSIWRWEDFNGNNVREAGEFSPDLDPAKLGDPANDAPVRTGRLEDGVSFRIHSDVTRSACGGEDTPPASPVSFQPKAGPPCNGSPCIRFDGKGFIEGTNGAAYLTDDNHSYAVSTNRAGILKFCRWDENDRNWVIVR